VSDHPAQPGPAAAPAVITLAGLQARFGRRWRLKPEPVISMLTAEQRSKDGGHIRYLVAADCAELAAKIERAEQVAP
jgi:hypothetical protein